jgi:two-component system, sensor histidine kinase and response regulator
MMNADLLKPLPLRIEQFFEEHGVLQEIFDSMPMQIVVKSLREESFGQFLFWNKMAEANLGISAEEAIGKTDAEFFSPAEAASFAISDREVAEHGQCLISPTENISSRRFGSRILRTIKTPIYDREGKAEALLVVSEDLTERKNAERELAQALNFLENVNSELPGVVFQFKAETDGRTGFSYLSDGIRLITGDLAAGVMSGATNLLERIVLEDSPAFLWAVARSRQEMTTLREEFRIRTTGGDLRWVLVNSSPSYLADGSTIWHGFITDITGQKETQEALRRGDERLHNALDAMRAAVWEVELADDTLYLSPEWGQLFQFSAAHYPVSVSQLLAFVHPEDRQLVTSRATDWRGQIEFRHLRGDGSYTWVLISGKSICGPNGAAIRQVGTIMEISERKRMEHQLVEAKEAAERASEAKGDFLAMMSHEIRTPLNAVLGFSDLLSATVLNSEQKDYLQTIQGSSSALLVVLNDVLDYSKIESGKLDLQFLPVEVTKVIRTAIEIFRPQAAIKGVKIHAVFSGGLPAFLMCDGARLSQIIHNLLSNAVKFTERGEIVVELLQSKPRAGAVWSLMLRVRDTGIGIDLERHPSLFDPFYQADSSTKRRRGGTGLGLAIVRRLVSLLHGTIAVSSQPGIGTIFEVSLPLQEPDQDEPITEEDKKRMSLNLGGLLKKIMIVEDNATNRRLVRLFLRNLGHHADEAVDGFAGVAMAQRTRYDVIFMDLEMPGMDGYEATQKIREIYGSKSPFIVALTAHAMPEYRERSFEAGMQAYLSKPVKKDELAKILRTAFRQ